MSNQPTEQELKYILADNPMVTPEKILNELLANGFTIVKTKRKENDDLYYDTIDLSMLEKGGSLRIRRLTQDGKRKFKATYKMQTGDNKEYMSRTELEFEIPEESIQSLIEVLKSHNIDVDLNAISPLPILRSDTQRSDVVIEKNGVQVCLSFDKTKYSSFIARGKEVEDEMVEIETVEQTGDGSILQEINNILKLKFAKLQSSHESKYQRGMARVLIQDRNSKNNPETPVAPTTPADSER